MNQSHRRSRSPLVWLGGCLLLLAACLCLLALVLGGVLLAGRQALAGLATGPTATTPTATTPTANALLAPPPTAAPGDLPPVTALAPATPTPIRPLNLAVPAEIEQQPVSTLAWANLEALRQTGYPVHDYYDSARRLGSRDPGPRTVAGPKYHLGDVQRFITDQGLTAARLAVISDHTYIWVEEGLNLPQDGLAEAAARFETDYYPLLVPLFGQEWRPGVDDDPHLSVLHLSSFESQDEIGYFDLGDEYPRTVYNASNQQEIVYLNMSGLTLGEPLYYGTLVHEVEHMIQWYQDGNESTWLDEGLAQLAETAVGLDSVDSTIDWLNRPETQLNTWAFEDDGTVLAHYGAAYLLATYFWEQLGPEAVRALAQHPANGLEAVRDVLRRYRPGSSLEQFLGDWAVANYLDGDGAGKPYDYEHVELGLPRSQPAIEAAPYAGIFSLNQNGIHYRDLEQKGRLTLSFAGDTRTSLLPVQPHSGQMLWLAPPLDNLSAQLTASFDLSPASQATLTFWAWYSLEEMADFVYVSVSADGGTSWELLSPDRARAGEFGPAFNGRSLDEAPAGDGWVQQSLSLNRYAGRPILVRFEALTDATVSDAGFALDDIAIPEIGYQSDVETGADGWQAAGFVRTGVTLPQAWSVRLIEHTRPPRVTEMALDALNQGQLSLDLGRRGATLVVMPLSQFSRTPAHYWLRLER